MTSHFTDEAILMKKKILNFISLVREIQVKVTMR